MAARRQVAVPQGATKPVITGQRAHERLTRIDRFVCPRLDAVVPIFPVNGELDYSLFDGRPTFCWRAASVSPAFSSLAGAGEIRPEIFHSGPGGK